MANTSGEARVTDVTPEELSRWLEAGEAVLVDVREPFERAEERIDGSIAAPLSSFDAESIRDDRGGARVVFHCAAGGRSADAAARYAQNGEAVYHLAGGINAWKAAERPTVRPARAPGFPVMRQVQIVAGSLVALGVALGLLVSPWFLAIPAFVGCGLVFAGASGWCGMALLLGRMPWNRPTGGACAPSSDR